MLYKNVTECTLRELYPDVRDFDISIAYGRHKNFFHQNLLATLSPLLKDLISGESFAGRKRDHIPIIIARPPAPEEPESKTEWEALQSIFELIYKGETKVIGKRKLGKVADLVDLLGIQGLISKKQANSILNPEPSPPEVVRDDPDDPPPVKKRKPMPQLKPIPENNNKDVIEVQEEEMEEEEEDVERIQEFTCCVCVKDFNSCLELINHYNFHESNKDPCDELLCSLCESFFDSLSELKNHLINKHDDDVEKLTCCPLCSFKGKGMEEIRNHIMSHFSEKLWDLIQEKQFINNKICKLCKSSLPSKKLNTIYHFGAYHGFVKRFLEEKVFYQFFNPTSTESYKNLRDDDNDYVTTEDDQIVIEMDRNFVVDVDSSKDPPPPESLNKCPFCDYILSKPNKTFMKEHAMSHFKISLNKDIQERKLMKKNNECTICGVTLQKLGHWKTTRHFAMVHKMLSKYTDDKLPDLFSSN